MRKYRYQLVVQFRADRFSSFDDMMELSGAVERSLPDGPEAFLDGHDSGIGEFNLFVLTNEPLAVFPIVQQAIEFERPKLKFSAAYRDRELESGDYVPLWPASLATFTLA